MDCVESTALTQSDTLQGNLADMAELIKQLRNWERIRIDQRRERLRLKLLGKVHVGCM